MARTLLQPLGRVLAVGVFLCGLSGREALAAFVAPDFRGEADTTYQEWNFFTSTTDVAPDVGVDNPNGDPTITSSIGSAMLSGNIYAFGAIDSFSIYIPDYGIPGRYSHVVMQTRTQGGELNYGSINIGGLAPASATELSRVALGGFGGFDVTYKFVWELPDNPSSFTISFSGVEHTSFDAVVVDTAAVPEAGSMVLASAALVGACGAWLARRRRLGRSGKVGLRVT